MQQMVTRTALFIMFIQLTQTDLTSLKQKPSLTALLSSIRAYKFVTQKQQLPFKISCDSLQFIPHQNLTAGLLLLLQHADQFTISRLQLVIIDTIYGLSFQKQLRRIDLCFLFSLSHFRFTKLIQVLIYLLFKNGSLGNLLGFWLLGLQLKSSGKSRCQRLVQILNKLLTKNTGLLQYCQKSSKGQNCKEFHSAKISHLFQTNLTTYVYPLLSIQSRNDSCTIKRSVELRRTKLEQVSVQAVKIQLKRLIERANPVQLQHLFQTLIVLASFPSLQKIKQVLGNQTDLFISYYKCDFPRKDYVYSKTNIVAEKIRAYSTKGRIDNLLQQLERIFSNTDELARKKVKACLNRLQSACY